MGIISLCSACSCVKDCEMIFVELQNTGMLHAGEFPGQSASFHAEIVGQGAAVHINDNLSGFLLMNLLGEKSDEFVPNGFFG